MDWEGLGGYGRAEASIQRTTGREPCSPPQRCSALTKKQSNPRRHGKQMRMHELVLASKERCYTTNAKKEEIFSDMSWARFTVADETANE